MMLQARNGWLGWNSPVSEWPEGTEWEGGHWPSPLGVGGTAILLDTASIMYLVSRTCRHQDINGYLIDEENIAHFLKFLEDYSPN